MDSFRDFINEDVNERVVSMRGGSMNTLELSEGPSSNLKIRHDKNAGMVAMDLNGQKYVITDDEYEAFMQLMR